MRNGADETLDLTCDVDSTVLEIEFFRSFADLGCLVELTIVDPLAPDDAGTVSLARPKAMKLYQFLGHVLGQHAPRHLLGWEVDGPTVLGIEAQCDCVGGKVLIGPDGCAPQCRARAIERAPQD